MRTRAFILAWFLMIFGRFGFSRALDCGGHPDPVIDSSNYPPTTITVDPFGNGDHCTVQKAIDAVPFGNQQWVRVHIQPGHYKEKVTVPYGKECIFLDGSGSSLTAIVWGDHLQTDTSATFTAGSNNTVAKGITFQNNYNRLAEGFDKYAPALAARIYGDKSSFHHCAFLGFQDTIWSVKGRHYFSSCYIEGAIDFIWGSGQTFFEDCSINVTAGLLPAGYITAQGRQSAAEPSGFVFSRGSITGIGQAYLGRAYGAYSRVVLIGTTMDAVVSPAGWDAWDQKGHEGNLYYAEAGCQGQGADTSKRVGWSKKELSGSELQQFSRQSFIDQEGWITKQPSLLATRLI